MLEALILWRLGSVDRTLRGIATDGLEEGEYDGVVAVLVLPAVLLAVLAWPVGLAVLAGTRLPAVPSLAVGGLAGAAVWLLWGTAGWAVAGLLVAAPLFQLLLRLDGDGSLVYNTLAGPNDDTTQGSEA